MKKNPEIKYFQNNVIQKITYFNDDGKIHKDDTPAVICYFPSGLILSETYYHNGLKENYGKILSYSRYNEKGSFIIQMSFVNDILHSKDLDPSIILYPGHPKNYQYPHEDSQNIFKYFKHGVQIQGEEIERIKILLRRKEIIKMTK